MTHVSQPFAVESAEKRLISLRFWLQGRNYHRTLRALEFNRRLFTGVRKDGLTPEFDHQVCQVQFLRTLPDLMFPEQTFATALFHDTPEDHGIAFEEILSLFHDDPVFGKQVSDATRRMTKTWRGEKIAPKELFERMAECPIASLGKGVDRIHNQQTMVRVFLPPKQRTYLQETEEFILPMLKAAERRFPEQEAAYKNVRTILKMQVELIDHALQAQGA